MALRAQITGAITEPVLRFTPKQQAVLDFRINATASARNKSTGQWEDIGAPLWVGVSFWDQDAHTFNDALGKGDRVTVEGTLIQETYQRRDGGEGSSLSLRFPRLLGVVPSRKNPATGSVPVAGASYAAPTEDPWGANPQPTEAPF